MALKTRADYFGISTGLDTRKLYPTSKLVSTITGMTIPRNKAIVGENAFAHEAGIHQHGVLQNAETYEIMKPEDIGIKANSLVLGKHSGKHAFRDKVTALGFDPSDEELLRAFEEFKKLADRKKELFDADIEAIIMNTGGQQPGPWTLDDLSFSSGRNTTAKGEVRLTHIDGRIVTQSAEGDGPVAAVFIALEHATGVTLKLKKFQVNSVTVGEDAQGEVTATTEYNGESYRGHGVSTDIVEAGALAYLEVINRISRRIESGAADTGSGKTKTANI
jgi:2-isopropylmalate synthase